MTVGLPGTGIGGLFYFCLVVIMPFREAWLTLQGRSSVARWKRVAFQWTVLLMILLALWGEGWLITRAVTYMSATDTWLGHRLHTTTQSATGEVVMNVGQIAAVASLLTLGAIVLSAAFLAALNRAGLLRKPSFTLPRFLRLARAA